MIQTLYGDILFLVNFTMDFLALYVTAAILHRKHKLVPYCVSSAIGAFYGVAACFISCTVIVGILINLAVSVVMCRIVFGKSFLTPLALFYSIGCLLGGVMTCLYSYMKTMSVSPSAFDEGSRTLGGGVPLGWMAVVALVTSFAAIAGGRVVNKKRACYEVAVEINNGEGVMIFYGICDSGNLLKEPISSKPVIILEKQAFLSVIPNKYRDFYENEGQIPEMFTEFALIPSRTVSEEKLLMGYVPKSVSINGIQKEAVIAMGNGSFDGKAALVPQVLCT